MATFGVEEEFILVDDAGRLVEEASETQAEAPTGEADLKAELWRSQVESATDVCSTAAQVETELTDLRRKLAAGAEGRGLRLVASGTTVHPQAGHLRVAPSARYQRMTAHFGELVFGGVTEGSRAHVGDSDPEDRIHVF